MSFALGVLVGALGASTGIWLAIVMAHEKVDYLGALPTRFANYISRKRVVSIPEATMGTNNAKGRHRQKPLVCVTKTHGVKMIKILRV